MLRAAGVLTLAFVLGGTACLHQFPGVARAAHALAPYCSDIDHRRARARLQGLLVVLCGLACLRRSPIVARGITALAALGPVFVAGVERHLREPWELWP